MPMVRVSNGGTLDTQLYISSVTGLANYSYGIIADSSVIGQISTGQYGTYSVTNGQITLELVTNYNTVTVNVTSTTDCGVYDRATSSLVVSVLANTKTQIYSGANTSQHVWYAK